MSGAIFGPGFLLKHSAHGANTFTTVSEVRDISGPSIVVETDDVTNQSSPNHFEEVAATLLRGGELTFTAAFLPADSTQDSSTGLLSFMQARSVEDWAIVMPQGGKAVTFSGFVTKFDPKMPVTKSAVVDCAIKLTGPMSIVAANTLA